MERAETRYARSGEVNVAYQVVGDGPFDLVLVPGFISNVEYGWEEPGLASFYRRLASFSRLKAVELGDSALRPQPGESGPPHPAPGRARWP